MSWNPEVNELFLKALEIGSPEERRSYLDAACRGDLRPQVEALLCASEKAGSFLECPLADLSETVDDPVVTERPGTVIGPYKLLEQIGEGGFGVVFMAEQSQPIRRKVALKVLKPGMDTRQVTARFEAERQALALMDHPNIAKVLDAGQTSSGRPYFVMDLVKGLPITDYCDQARLTPRERLELFLHVCQAVQHAHQKGIIHRDIKPWNVLVTLHDGTPEPKIIDFGIAKALGQQLTDKTVHTQFAQMIGTPLYMSPEQAASSNVDVDTRSDIYSLGVLLYELLTGTTPFDRERFMEVGYDEMLRIIREEDPPKPSARISTLGQVSTAISTLCQGDSKKLSQLLCGELDWIVMKALEKDRKRRYETASAFAADVQRYLADEPVLACPPSRSYRVRKFARRHRKGLVVVAGFAVLLITATAVSTALAAWGMRAQSTARQEEESAKKALAAETLARKKTRQSMARISDRVVEQSFGRKVQLTEQDRKFLRDILKDYEEFAAETGDTAEARELRAEGFFRVGVLRHRLGELTDAEIAYGMALTIQAELAADFPAEPRYRQELAQIHNSLGGLLYDLGKRDQAEAAYRAALTILDQLLSDFPTVPQYRQALAANYNNLGLLLKDLRKHDQAESAYRAALIIQEKLVTDFPTVPEYRLSLAKSANNVGLLLVDLGKRDQAKSAYSAAITIWEKLSADYPTVPEYRQELAWGHSNLGALLAGLGRRDETDSAYRAALTIRAKLAADFPTIPQYREDLVKSHHNLGAHLHSLGKRDEAETAYRAALTIVNKLVADFPTVPQYRRELGMTHHNLGALLYDQSKPGQAEAAYRAALTIQEKLAADYPNVPEYRQELANSHNGLGNLLLYGLRQQNLAETAYRAALAIRKKLASDFPDVPAYAVVLGGSYCNLGNLLSETNRFGDALEWYQTAIQALGEVLGKDTLLVTAKEFLRNAHWGRARALDKLERYAEAIDDWNRAIQLDEGPNRQQFRLELARSHAKLGILLAGKGKGDQAESAYRTALSIQEKFVADFPTVPDCAVELAGSYCNLGNLLSESNRLGDALEWYQKAIQVLDEVLTKDNRLVTAKEFLRNSYWGRARALDKLKRYSEAINDWDRAIQLDERPNHRELRLLRTISHARAGNHAKAVSEASELAHGKDVDAAVLYDLACVCSLASAAVKPAGPYENANVEQLREKCATRAVEMLRRAVDKGYKDVGHMKEDTDLDCLRQRKDFKELIAELEANPKE
jgi:serine/threonine protein kinase/tetratricopeptide (TPR) repeat protein